MHLCQFFSTVTVNCTNEINVFKSSCTFGVVHISVEWEAEKRLILALF